MCVLNWQPWDHDGPDLPLPLAQPRLMWAIPVDVSELGASIEAYADTIPQVTTLRVCHRFSNGSLSKLPQEIVEQVVDEIRRTAMEVTAPVWRREFMCFQNRCTPNDHFEAYDEVVESAWFSLTDGGEYPQPPGLEDFDDESAYQSAYDAYWTHEKKLEFVRENLESDPELLTQIDDGGCHEARGESFLDRTCMCKKPRGSFLRFNKILKSHFGLEAVIMHEVVSTSLNLFMQPLHRPCGCCHISTSVFNHTLGFLTLASSTNNKHVVGGRTVQKKHRPFGDPGSHQAFQHIIDTSLLTLSDNQSSRFKKAMSVLHLSPRFQFSELEPLIEHPIKDDTLADLCGCPLSGCRKGNYDFAERADKIEQFLQEKSDELAKESWPKLMMVAASDAATPTVQDE